MSVYEDKFFKNIQNEVCVLLNMKSVLDKLKSINMFGNIRKAFSQVLRTNLHSFLEDKFINLDVNSLSLTEKKDFKFELNSKTFVFKENLKFICMYISKSFYQIQFF